MIDLHSHTTASDGTYTPQQLVDAAVAQGLEALAITDHDTFAGYEEAKPYAEAAGLRLVCGIELSTKSEMVRRTVHLLGYFPDAPPAAEFVGWLQQMKESRRDRNRRLADRLQSMGFDIRLEEVESLGRNMAGRPHFARLMVAKGYVSNTREAFDRYLDESAPGYVDRNEPSLEEGIRRIGEAGGYSSIAHPVRLNLKNAEQEEELLGAMAQRGLSAVEVYHSDHDAGDSERYLNMARKFGLKITGGSDFHGENKPNVRLGTGPGTLSIPLAVLEGLSA